MKKNVKPAREYKELDTKHLGWLKSYEETEHTERLTVRLGLTVLYFLNWLPVCDRLYLNDDAIMTFKCIHNLVPDYLAEKKKKKFALKLVLKIQDKTTIWTFWDADWPPVSVHFHTVEPNYGIT